MMSRVREKIPILKLLSKIFETIVCFFEEKLVPGRGKGGECPGTSAGQAKALTAGDMTAATSGPAGVPVTLAATWGWSITPTRMASAPTALSAKVAAWANFVFMDQPSLWFSLRRHILHRFVGNNAWGVPIAARRRKPRNFTPKPTLHPI
jgi:hypothetical protein